MDIETKDAFIERHLAKIHDSLDAASIQWFLKTGKINGGFRDALLRLIDAVIKHDQGLKFHQAVELMKQGKKMTHRFFSSDEWVTMQDGLMVFEDGVKCTPNQFLMDRTDLAWSEDWSEFMS